MHELILFVMIFVGIDAGVKPILNLKGYLVGNGVADSEFDGNALVPFAHGMGLISDELFEVCFSNTFPICDRDIESDFDTKHLKNSTPFKLQIHANRCDITYDVAYWHLVLKRIELFITRFTMQAVNSECNGVYYNPTSQNCENKLVKVDEVSRFSICRMLKNICTFFMLDSLSLSVSGNQGPKHIRHSRAVLSCPSKYYSTQEHECAIELQEIRRD